MSTTIPLRGSGGGRTLIPELWIVDTSGTRIGDLTEDLIGCTVEWTDERKGAPAMRCRFGLRRPSALVPLRDIVAPRLTVRYDDGRPDQILLLGQFLVDLPQEHHIPGSVTADYEGVDLTWVLGQSYFTEPWTVPVGADLASAMGTITQQAGITRYRYNLEGAVAGRSRTFRPATSRLAALNRLCKASRCYPVGMDLDGTLVTMRYRSRERSDPWRVLTTADPVDDVEVKPETTDRVANVVIVVGERPDNTPIVAIRKNTNPAHPASTVALGREIVYGGQPIRDSDIEDQAGADALAEELLERAGSYYRSVTIRLLPDAVPGPWQIVELRSFVNAGVDLSGRYWIKGWRMGVTPDDGVLELSLNRLTYLVEGA